MLPHLFILSYILTLTISSYQDCGYHFSNKSVTFDISPLTLTEQSSLNYYNITSGNYHYLLNFCADVISPPSTCIFYDKQNKDEIYINNSVQNRPGNITSDIFQYTENFCFRLSGSSSMEPIFKNTLINYELIDNNDPSFGFILHYHYGDHCKGNQKNREAKIAFICDANINTIPKTGISITEPETCLYQIEIKSIYGCPLECGRDINDNLCSNNGVCGYDYDINTARCYCFAGFQGHYCNESAPFYGNVSWYDAIETRNDSQYIYTFQTIYDYNITYDLQYIVDGYINDEYYLLDDNSTNRFYINLFDSFNTVINSLPVCTRNDELYDYGYIFKTVDNMPGAPCYSLGRNAPIVELYDETMPTKGVKITYSNGDNIEGTDTCVNGTRTNIYFICPDSNQHERIDTFHGLNNIFNEYKFVQDETGCVYSIEIFTSIACPYNCITYDYTNDMLSQCNAAGICAYDYGLDITRCICEHLEVTKPEHIQCYDANITYSPTEEPTKSPTFDANIQWYRDVKVSNVSDYIYQFNTVYGYNVTYDLQYVVNGYLNGKYYKLQDDKGHNIYFNLFNKTYTAGNTLKGICDNNVHDYNYGYVFQAKEDNSLDKCFSLGRSEPNVELYNESNPTTGVSISFEGGDNTYCNSKRRSMRINLICPSDGGIFERYKLQNNIGLNDIYSQYEVYEEWDTPCEYDVDIITSAACPSQCITYDSEKNAVSACTTNGVCDYDNAFKLVRCVCNNNMQINSIDDIFCANDNITYSPTQEPSISPSKQPTQTPSQSPTLPPYITWIDIEPNNKSDYIYEFQTKFGYNVTYDLLYFVMGYLDDKYYKLSDSAEHDVYFNLFNSTIINEHPNIAGICDVNAVNYSFGYIYQAHKNDPRVECRSIGRQGPNVKLYDENNPWKGIKLSYEDGDSMGCQARRTDINLICPDNSSEFEIYRDNSLNDRFSMYKFSEPSTCEYTIDIYTSSACPIQCMTYETNKPSISQCFTNGYCSYSGVIRCICNDNMIINDKSDIFCQSDSITYNPTEIPTINPTIYPTEYPTTSYPTNIPTNSPTHIEKYSLYGQWAKYDKKLDLLLIFEIGVDEVCENFKFTFITPAASCYDNMWFAIGMGGNYGIGSFDSDSDEQHDESGKMNGYAIVTFIGAVPEGYEQAYESTLEAGVFPEAQSNNDLRNCVITVENCMQTIVCYRDYETNDNDFYEFIEGINPIIYGFGQLDDNNLPIKHIDAEDSFIELSGAAQCGYAKTVNDEANTGDSDDDTNNGNKKDENDHIWNIIAIVFIVLFLLMIIFCCIYWNKNQKGKYGPHGYSHGRVNSGDGNTQMTSIDEDDVSPKRDTAKLITTKGDDLDDLL